MGLFSNKQSSQLKPPKWLQQDLINASKQFANLPTPVGFDQPWAVGMNPMLSQGLQAQFDFGANNPYATQMGAAGQAGLGAMGSGLDYLSNLTAGGGPGFQFDQGVFDQTMQNLRPAMAGTYADLTRDIDRNLMEQQIPGLNTAAAGTGNMASSRAGVAQGIMERGAADRRADIASQLTQAATGQAQQAGMTGGLQNLAAQLQTQGDVLGNLRGFAGQGLSMLPSAYNAGAGSAGLMSQAGGTMQDYLQGMRDLNRQQFYYDQALPQQFAQNQLQTLSNVGQTFGKQESETSTGLGNVAMQLGAAYLTGGGSLLAGGLMGGGGGGALPGPSVGGFSAPSGGFGFNPYASAPSMGMSSMPTFGGFGYGAAPTFGISPTPLTMPNQQYLLGT